MREIFFCFWSVCVTLFLFDFLCLGRVRKKKTTPHTFLVGTSFLVLVVDDFVPVGADRDAPLRVRQSIMDCNTE